MPNKTVVNTAETAKQTQVPPWLKTLMSAYVPPRSRDDVPAVDFGLGDDDASSAAWQNAVKVMGDVWKNEETRFNNITGRGATMLGGTSLIATLLGYVSKGLFTGAAAPLEGAVGDAVKVLTTVALVLFAATVGVLVFGVLVPRGRFVFGNNKLVGGATSGGPATGHGEALTSAGIDKVVATGYAGMYVALANPSRRKAYWLNVGYTTFGLAAALGFVVVLLLVLAS